MENELPKFDAVSLLTIENTVLSCAVEALIATHPNPERVRAIYDQLMGQIQANLLVSGEPPEAMTVARQLTNKLFSPT
jgi:hypothetical protein